ncbi:MAG: hypothetical protein AW10_01950 [Candidatus Accumulibacter appositus]|uniref:Uncharacterized protein n=2 Tax=Candidatus Accumulibacter TaxID=327159 RepID=A0A011NBY5_9PROT|nr:MAG: hypothetical protein AW10_01950 [Candidatus Accumulibacter appositus]
MTRSKGKGWQRDELLLAMNLYCRIPFGRQRSGAPEVIELAEALGRTPGSVAMKLNNLTSLDPQELARGVKGLHGASRLDRLVWEEFQTDWESLVLESERLWGDVFENGGSRPIAEAGDALGDRVTESDHMGKVRLKFRALATAIEAPSLCFF